MHSVHRKGSITLAPSDSCKESMDSWGQGSGFSGQVIVNTECRSDQHCPPVFQLRLQLESWSGIKYPSGLKGWASLLGVQPVQGQQKLSFLILKRRLSMTVPPQSPPALQPQVTWARHWRSKDQGGLGHFNTHHPWATNEIALPNALLEKVLLGSAKPSLKPTWRSTLQVGQQQTFNRESPFTGSNVPNLACQPESSSTPSLPAE